MKRIKDFQAQKVNKSKYHTIRGGKVVLTEATEQYPCGDTWYDHNNNGIVDEGDEVCIDDCPSA